jgi:hypothetical protein
LLALAGLGAALLVASTTSPMVLATEESRAVKRLQILPVAAAVVGLICAAISARLVATDEWDAQWWWLTAMALPTFALLCLRARDWKRAGGRPGVSLLELSGIAALLAVAVGARLPDLLGSPPFVYGDEGSQGLYGRLFNTGHVPLLSISWDGLPALTYAVSGVGLHLFDSLFGLRLINVVIGTVSVLLVYLVGKEWFGRRAGAIGAFVLAVSFLHVELSRNGLHVVPAPACITLTLYLVTLWLKKGGALTALLAGMSLILDLQVYWSARLAPLLVVSLLAFLWVFDRPILEARRLEAGWLLAGAVLAGLPVAALFRAVPGSFNGHQTGVSIFSDDPAIKGHLISVYGHIGTLQLLQEQAWRFLSTFSARGDATLVFGPWGGSLLDGISAALLPAAVFLMLIRCRHWQYALCFAWFAGVVVAGIVTVDPPTWPRTLALMPAVALMIGVLLSDLWGMFGRLGLSVLLIGATFATLLGVMAAENLHEVFVDYPAAMSQFGMGATDVGKFLARSPRAGNTVLFSDGSLYLSHETIRFLAPSAAGCTLMPGQKPTSCPIYRTSKLYVFLPGRLQDVKHLQRENPGSHVDTVGTYDHGASRVLALELR